MKRILVGACPIVLLVLLSAGIPFGHSGHKQTAKSGDAKPLQEKELQAEMNRLLPIFQALGEDDVKDKHWVRIDTGPSNWNRKVYGWLIKHGKTTIRFLSQNGERLVLKKPATGAKRAELKGAILLPQDSSLQDVVWVIENEDFAAFCQKFLTKGIPQFKEQPNQFGPSSIAIARHELSSHAIEASRYACWAQQRGQKELALRLVERATTAYKQFGSEFVGGDTAALANFVAERLASNYRNGATYWGHKGTPRPELLKEWQIVARLPAHCYRDEAERMVEGYRRLIAEDKVWQEPTPEALAKMTDQQKVNYWLHHLRDWDIGQSMDPGMCDVLDRFGWGQPIGEKKRPNPALELKNLGYIALPEIINHLDDPRPTRCKGHWRRYWPEGHHLLTYGDCCQQIFEAITAHTIYERRTTNSYPSSDGKMKECKERALKWYQEFKKKGEKQVLIDGTAQGDHDSTTHARRLVNKFPEVAFPALAQGIEHARKNWIRANLVGFLADLKDPGVPALLVKETKGPFLLSRVAAARLLARRGRPEGIQVLLSEWQRLDARKHGSGEDDHWDTSTLIGALVDCQRIQAIRGLAKDLRKRPVVLRAEVIDALDRTAQPEAAPLDPGVARAVTECLVECLDDPEEQRGASRFCSTKSGGTWEDPRICDRAAVALAGRWGQSELFDPLASKRVRESQIVALKNQWLQSQGKAPLPAPAPVRIRRAPADLMVPKLQQILAAKTPAQQVQACAAVARLGLPALPAVQEWLAKIGPDHPARPSLQALAVQLAGIVQEVNFGRDSVPPAMLFRDQVDAFRGKPLAEKEMVDLLVAVTSDLPPGVSGLRIELERAGDDTGISMTITLLPPDDPPPGGAIHFRVYQRINLDGHNIPGGSSMAVSIGGGPPPIRSAEEWKEFAGNLRTVLHAPPEKSFSVLVEAFQGR